MKSSFIQISIKKELCLLDLIFLDIKVFYKKNNNFYIEVLLETKIDFYNNFNLKKKYLFKSFYNFFLRKKYLF